MQGHLPWQANWIVIKFLLPNRHPLISDNTRGWEEHVAELVKVVIVNGIHLLEIGNGRQ